MSSLLAQRRVLPGEEYQTAERARSAAEWWSGAPGVRAGQTTHSSPMQGFRGPLRCLSTSPRAAWWLGSTPPVYPTVLPTRIPVLARTRRRTHHDEHVTVSGDTQFETTVGEPRGVEHSPVFRVLTVFSTDQELSGLHLIMTETGL